MVKLDFANAFNSLHRSDMLLSVRDCLPELYASACHLIHNRLFCISVRLSSCLRRVHSREIHKNPPFCTTIHPLVSSMGSDLTLGYLDDLSLAGPQNVVASDIQKVVAEGSKMGLCLNPSKREVICHPDINIVDQTN